MLFQTGSKIVLNNSCTLLVCYYAPHCMIKEMVMAGRGIIIIATVLCVGCGGRMVEKQGGRQERTPTITYAGGNGDSFEEAVILRGVQNQSDGVAAEYTYITKLHGERGKGWFLVGQTIVRESTKILDVLEIRLDDPAHHLIYYFDVSDFSWNKK